MKQFAVALVMASCMAAPAMAQDFLLGEETRGISVKADDADMRIRVRLQPRWDFGDVIVNKDASDYASESDMYLRRIRLEIDGRVMKNLKYNLTLDSDRNGQIGRSNEVKTLYAFMDYKISDPLNVRFGKAKLPFSRVSLASSARQLLIERPVSTEAAKGLFDDYYQPNLLLHGTVAEGMVGYQFALADGWENTRTIYARDSYRNGVDSAATTVFKSGPLGIARIEVAPPGWVEKGMSDAHLGKGQHLTFGVHYGTQAGIQYSDANTAAAGFEEDRKLTGFDVSFHLGGFTAQAEYNAWEQKYTDPNKRAKEPEGWYLQAGYFIPGMNIEPVARYEVYEQDTNAPAGSDDTELTTTTLGLNWYLKGHSFKMGLNWARSDVGDNVSISGVTGAEQDKRDIYQLQAQVYF